MSIVITGALGHIGSRVLRELPKLLGENEVRLVDNLLTQRYCSLFDLPTQTRYRFVEADVTTHDLHRLLEGARVVIHLAAITDAAGSFDNREAVEHNNYEATARVAVACADVGAALIHLSSTSVYGTQKSQVDEDCGPEELAPQSPYAETKLREESLVREMVSDGRLRGVSCRFGTIFGTSPGMRFHTAVNKFCWQAAMGLPLTVWRTAYDQVRPYLSLDDAVRALAFVVERDLFDGRVINVVTANRSVHQITDLIASEIPGLSIEYVDTRIMNQLSYEVGNARLSEAGFEFVGDLEAGVRETIARLCRAGGR